MNDAHDDRSSITTVALLGGVRPDSQLSSQCTYLGRALAGRPWRVIVGAAAGPLAAFIDAASKVSDRRLQIDLLRYEDSRYCSDAQTDNVIIVDDVFERLRMFSQCDAFIVAGGELGATAELLMIWNFLQARRLLHRRIIVLGDRATERATSISTSLKFSTERYRTILRVAGCFREAIKALDASLNAEQIVPPERRAGRALNSTSMAAAR